MQEVIVEQLLAISEEEIPCGDDDRDARESRKTYSCDALFQSCCDPDCSRFAVENKAIPILLRLLTGSHKPRLNSLAFGTLANMSSSDQSVKEIICGTPEVLAVSEAVASSESDPETLSELCRLALCGASSQRSRMTWSDSAPLAGRCAFWVSNSFDPRLVFQAATLASAMSFYSPRATARLASAGYGQSCVGLLSQHGAGGPESFPGQVIAPLVSFLANFSRDSAPSPSQALRGEGAALAKVIVAWSGDPAQDVDAKDTIVLLAELVSSGQADLPSDGSLAGVLVQRALGEISGGVDGDDEDTSEAVWSLIAMSLRSSSPAAISAMKSRRSDLCKKATSIQSRSPAASSALAILSRLD